MAYRGPSIQTHLEWLGLVQPVGLVVAPVVLDSKELYPESQVTTLADGQRRLADLLEERELESGHKAVSVGSFERFATEILEWSNSDIKPATEHPTPIEVVLEEYGEVLKPSHVVAGAGPDNKHDVLVQELPAGTAMDALLKGDGHGWEASPHHRFERLLKESEHPIGLLFNGEALRLIFAPRGESSGYITFPLEPMTTVAGRPMLGALQMLLGVDRMFSGSSDQRLPELLNESRKRQNDVSTSLAEQVLEALWELLLGFDEAERNAQNKGTTVLGDLPKQDPDHIYGGLITVLLRLVFLLYAEDEDLMPPDSLYGQHYSVSGLAIRLRQEADEHKGGMASRRGAWASLLSLFRLVYDGGGATEAYLPARHGELFDPDAYPFLEGRNQELGYEAGILENLPAISDDVVEKVLSKLLWLDGERLSYRALDVEQIGSVYEGIMGFRVEQAQGTSVGITHRPPRQKITISVVVNAEELLEQPANKRNKWLETEAGIKLSPPLTKSIQEGLKKASSVEEILEALGKRLSPHTPRGLNPGSLVLQPTAERRRSGSHYTPRSLTEPIVKEAFRPWLERNDHKPTAEAILDLKVCDPAMGSGAFLVATCRYLAGLLVEAWERDGFPTDFEEAWDKDIYARRLVAQRCLYGVDKNPFAVNLARLSLWLVTLSKELPFTFVDHALKCGDSLVGVSRKEIESALKTATKQRSLHDITIQRAQEQEAESYALFQADSRSDADDARKRKAWKQLQKSTAYLNTVGDLLVAAFFNGKKDRDRQQLRELYLAATLEFSSADELEEAMEEPLEQLRSGEKGIKPLHWQLAFPEVFKKDCRGFDAFVGNPPFQGSVGIAASHGDRYSEYLRNTASKASGKTDLCAFFFRKSIQLTAKKGTISFITSNTISQGDTRRSSLTQILREGNTIFSAKKRMPWPGIASVITSVIHIQEGECKTLKTLNGNQVGHINQFLINSCSTHEPIKLDTFKSISYLGCKPGKKGFVIGNKKGNIPIQEAKEHIQSNPSEKAAIKNFLGGEELNNNVNSQPDRFIIHIKEEEKESFPESLKLLKKYLGASNTTNANWHKFSAPASEMMKKLELSKKCILLAETSSAFTFETGNSETIYANSIWCFFEKFDGLFALLQSALHEEWTRMLTSTLKDDLRYVASDCIETLPIPIKALNKDLKKLETEFHQSREQLKNENGATLRGLCQGFNNPKSNSQATDSCRRKWIEINTHLLDSIGIKDEVEYGFRLDHLDTPDDWDPPTDLERIINIGDFYFEEKDEAIRFEQRCKAEGVKKSLGWRYTWSTKWREKILDKMLTLNEESALHKTDQQVPQGIQKHKRISTPSKKNEQQLGIGGVV